MPWTHPFLPQSRRSSTLHPSAMLTAAPLRFGKQLGMGNQGLNTSRLLDDPDGGTPQSLWDVPPALKALEHQS